MTGAGRGRRYTVGSLFAGIGGIDLAFTLAGFDIAWQVEIDDYCNRVLARHWPDAVRLRDVRDASAANLRRVDVMVGGFPCQDISVAGRGAGIQAGTRSGLWFEFERLIGELRPRVVLLENVADVTARDGDVVIGSLAALGYDARWGTVRAADAGAPHRRERWFCVAYAATQRLEVRTSVTEDTRQECASTSRDCVGYAHSGGCTGHNSGDRDGAQPAGRHISRDGAWARPQPRLGRGADGLPYRLDAPRWPAGPGPRQHAWEPPRVTARRAHRTARLRALGNAVVPQVVYPLALAVHTWLALQDAGKGSECASTLEDEAA